MLVAVEPTVNVELVVAVALVEVLAAVDDVDLLLLELLVAVLLTVVVLLTALIWHCAPENPAAHEQLKLLVRACRPGQTSPTHIAAAV